MSSATCDDRTEGVKFIREDGGRVTARDIETGIASFGETKSEALAMLAEALALHEGGGEPVTDDDLEEWRIDPDAQSDESLSEFWGSWSDDTAERTRDAIESSHGCDEKRHRRS